jgi:hypothetical protein
MNIAILMGSVSSNKEITYDKKIVEEEFEIDE